MTSRHRVPTRNVSSRLLHRFAIALAIGVIGVGSAIAAPAAVDAVFGANGPEPIKSAPANDAAGVEPCKPIRSPTRSTPVPGADRMPTLAGSAPGMTVAAIIVQALGGDRNRRD